MIPIATFLLLCVVSVFGELVTPECNYVAIDHHFYPIAACTTTRNVSDSDSTYYALRYICESGDVIKYEYDTDEYCDGQAVQSTNITNELDDYECNLEVCEYSNGCSYSGCYEENVTDSCQECRENKQLYDRHCFPIITGYCNGNIGEILKSDECENGALKENIFLGTNCSSDAFIFSEITGGSNATYNCYADTYYEVDCIARDLPDCSYAATGTHYYPIHSCDRTKTITDSGVDYFAFQYICVNNDVYRKEYDTSEYCQGTATKSEKVNHLLEHYDCDLDACRWADGCSLSLSSCNGDQCLYNMHCLPTVADNCIGNIGELMHFGTCVNNTLNESFYYGESCDDVALWSEVFSGDDSECGEDIYYKVQCIESGPNTDYVTTECTRIQPTTTEEQISTIEADSVESTTTTATENPPSAGATYRVYVLWLVVVQILVLN